MQKGIVYLVICCGYRDQISSLFPQKLKSAAILAPMFDWAGGFLLHNLLVIVALVVIPLKLAIVKFCGDDEAQSGALLAMPEDLCYIILGLILADVDSGAKAFRRHFEGSTHVVADIVVVGLFTLALAVGTQLLAKMSNEDYKGWRAAAALQSSIPKAQSSAAVAPAAAVPVPVAAAAVQGTTGSGGAPPTAAATLIQVQASADDDVRMIGIHHAFSFALVYAVRLVSVVMWLTWIAHVVGNS